MVVPSGLVCELGVSFCDLGERRAHLGISRVLGTQHRARRVAGFADASLEQAT